MVTMIKLCVILHYKIGASKGIINLVPVCNTESLIKSLTITI